MAGRCQPGVGGAAGGRHHRRRVLHRLAGHDVARAEVLLDQVHDAFAGLDGELVAGFVHRRRACGMREREPDRLGDAGHGVGGELTAAGAAGGAGHRLDLGQVLLGDLALVELPVILVDIHDRDVLAAEAPRQDGAAIEEDPRHVEPHQRHHHAGQRLVAAGDADQRVVGVAAHGELDRIGDHVTRDQRRLHALMAHGDAVGHRDRGELARRAARLVHAGLRRLRLTAERDVAGRGLVPGGRHAHDGPAHRLAGDAHGIEEGPVRGALGPLGDVPARQLRLVESRAHGAFPPRTAHSLAAVRKFRVGRLG